jgi:hypothetical protein
MRRVTRSPRRSGPRRDPSSENAEEISGNPVPLPVVAEAAGAQDHEGDQERDGGKVLRIIARSLPCLLCRTTMISSPLRNRSR